jgi:hypothetical protein
MSESVTRTHRERVIQALGFSLLALLVAALDYWTYHVLSSHGVIAGVSILIVSYVALSLVLWLLCIVAHAVGAHRRAKPENARCEPQSACPHQASGVGRFGSARGAARRRGSDRRRHPLTRLR